MNQGFKDLLAQHTLSCDTDQSTPTHSNKGKKMFSYFIPELRLMLLSNSDQPIKLITAVIKIKSLSERSTHIKHAA